MPERWTGPADIAWCEEHGLHGARDRCFECDKPVEQIRMVSIDELCKRIQAELHSEPDGCIRLDGLLGEAIAEEAGNCSLEFVTPEQLALGICSWLNNFGPRQHEDGEGVKPADPSDGAESTNGGVVQKAAPDAGEQEGAERSRVGRPSDAEHARHTICVSDQVAERLADWRGPFDLKFDDEQLQIREVQPVRKICLSCNTVLLPKHRGICECSTRYDSQHVDVIPVAHGRGGV